jgi:hypothetical protein
MPCSQEFGVLMIYYAPRYYDSMNAIAVFIADLIPAKGSRYFPLGKKRRRIIFSLLPQVLLLWLASLGKVLLLVWLG